MRRFLVSLLGLLLLTPLLAFAMTVPLLTHQHSLVMAVGVPRLDPLDPINRTLKMRFLPGVSPYNLAPFNSAGTPSNGPKLQSTDRGMAMVFDGVTANQYLGSMFYGTMFPSPPALTWCVLFKADAAAGTAKFTTLVNRGYVNGNSADDQFATNWDRGDGNLAAISVYNGASYIFIKPPVTPAAGVWNDICGTWSSVSPFPMIEYVNGVQVASANTFGTLNNNNVNTLMAFPRLSGGSSPWAGKIAQVFISERVLSPSEILRLHNDPWAGLIFPGDRIDAQARAGNIPSAAGTVLRAPLTHW